MAQGMPGSSPTVGAVAIVRAHEPVVFLAEDVEAMNKVLALHLVAQLPASEVSSEARLREMQEALLQERWADALIAWIDETGTPVDVYEEAPKVWSEADLDSEQASMEIRMAPLFSRE